MKSIIQQLYDGELNGYENTNAVKPEHIKALGKISDEKQYFMGRLSTDDRTRFENLENLMDEVTEFEKQGAFSLGFRMAALMIMEIFNMGIPTNEK